MDTSTRIRMIQSETAYFFTRMGLPSTPTQTRKPHCFETALRSGLRPTNADRGKICSFKNVLIRVDMAHTQGTHKSPLLPSVFGEISLQIYRYIAKRCLLNSLRSQKAFM